VKDICEEEKSHKATVIYSNIRVENECTWNHLFPLFYTKRTKYNKLLKKNIVQENMNKERKKREEEK